MSISLSQRARRVRLSPIAAAGQRATALAAQGRDILALTAGEPEFDTPEAIKRAAIAALARGETKYTPTAGTVALRRTIAARYQRDHGLAVTPAEVFVANGGKQVIFEAFAATLDSGDEVLLPAPYWPSFPDIVRVNDGTPVVLPCDERSGFKLDAARFEAAITPRTRWLVLNTPANPTGAVYSADELAALAEVLRRHPHVLVLVDEIYEQIRFGAAPPHWLHVAPDLRARTLLVNGASKTYAMTGWRIGWGIAPTELVQAMTAIQSQVSSGASAIGQAAVEAALDAADQTFVQEARVAYARRAALVTEAIPSIPGLRLLPPQGAFFAYVNCDGLIGRLRPDGRPIEGDADVVDWLLEAEGVAVVDGAAYGLSPYFRLSFAVADTVLEDALRRIERAVAALQPALREVAA
ncbi:aminotransferase class I/II-fold pyridoxal phosphate-dependent enzyme (plasmid) [Cupriavidus necator]|uniref:Aminotransferase n=1 Tax=Cupriavidus necator TaxID=106590 RepID=A0A367PTK1_CUPNE|nr:aminotransferase class I/II-fold pyridoxal phosphate-dependent enzyme [Cupriavidus necator]QQX89700.1 aminotransferase class I/II-fold pyridoxal phosphate-dependent enzyme [Cupriavidus necator]RCJ10427.1 aminotransferase class I/II-fold pyridoxal phosphate-dependent enzyme [Cupriavidus necator]